MKLKIAASLVISIFFLYLSFQNIDFSNFKESLQSTNYPIFIFATLFTLAIFVGRAYRWQILLEQKKKIKLKSVLDALSIGYFGNNVLPMKAGEFLRAYVIGKNEDIPKSSVLATVFVERVLDVLSLLAAAIIVVLLFPIPPSSQFEEIKKFGMVLFGIEMIIILVMILLVTKRDFTLNIINKILNYLPNKISNIAKDIIAAFIDGLEIVTASDKYFRLILSSVIIWIAQVIHVYLMLIAFDFGFSNIELFYASNTILVVTLFAMVIPAGPAAVGTYHLFAQQSLMIFGIAGGNALAFATLMHISGVLPITIFGFYNFLKQNIKYASIQDDKVAVQN